MKPKFVRITIEHPTGNNLILEIPTKANLKKAVEMLEEFWIQGRAHLTPYFAPSKPKPKAKAARRSKA